MLRRTSFETACERPKEVTDEMKCTQSITYSAAGKPVRVCREIPVTKEADEARHLESGVINLYPEIGYQTIEGFGGAMTETAASLFMGLPEEERKAALSAYFGPEGSHAHFIRTSIDSCDYSLEEYQAVADPVADPDFATFTLDRDRKYILPMIKEAMAMSSEPLEVLLSPWSPPYQWKTPPARPKNDTSVYGGFFGMKEPDYDTPQRNNGGSLKPEFYGAWARYLAMYVRGYLDEGIPVTMMTMQNESIAATSWDSCVWTAAEQKLFLKDHLYPAFEEAGLADKVGIFIWDHNKERVFEWAREMIDETTAPMIAGIAFHWYSGDHFEAVALTAEKFPGKTLMLSECCGLHKPGTAGFDLPFLPRTKTPETAETEDAVQYAHDIIGNLNAGMQRWIDWNFCVDTGGGPRHVPGGFTAPMIVDGAKWRVNLSYDYICHFSRFILPGAKRIAFSRCDDVTEMTAARNPDGSVVLVTLNRTAKDAFYAVRIEGSVIRFDAPAGTIGTLVIE